MLGTKEKGTREAEVLFCINSWFQNHKHTYLELRFAVCLKVGAELSRWLSCHCDPNATKSYIQKNSKKNLGADL